MPWHTTHVNKINPAISMNVIAYPIKCHQVNSEMKDIKSIKKAKLI
jgi:hypothetical protein